MFFAGWDDSYLGSIVLNSNGGGIAVSPNKIFYENSLRSRHKENNYKATDLLSLALINRAISIFNILLSESRFSVSTESDKNLNNQYEINKLSLHVGIK